MKFKPKYQLLIVSAAVLIPSLLQGVSSAANSATTPTAVVGTVAGMPPVVDAGNLYSETKIDQLEPEVKNDLQRVYVPNLRSNDVSVIDPKTLKVVDRFKVGRSPQHIVPSWDLRTLWVANNAERGRDGSLTPIDPRTGKPGKAIAVDDPYNLYFSPDGRSAIVVAEAKRRLDFRDPKTLALQYSIEAPNCGGLNHGDFSIDGRYAIFTCEFAGTVVKIDLIGKSLMGYLKLTVPKTRFKDSVKSPNPLETEICTVSKGMPQDIRISPNGKLFYVADMATDGVHIIDGESFKEVAFVVTGVAPHGLYPSRDGKVLFVANRGSHAIHGKKKGPGSVTVIDFASNKPIVHWLVPGGGSPDMGNVSNDGKWLWLSGRFDDVVYRFDTSNGSVDQIKVGQEPHGLTVWPQPGRYSLGHTGNLR
ncbi:MAG: YncE family protein [Burkholderiales bacterium]|nr:YncE family protein [Burkholderiales bacterium]